MHRKYVPELNCFLRRWKVLGGPSKIEAFFHPHPDISVHGPGKIFLSGTLGRVRMEAGENERWWFISPAARSAKIRIRKRVGRIQLEVFDFFGTQEIGNYWYWGGS